MAKDIFVSGTGRVAMALESIESLTESLLEILEDKEKFVRSKHMLSDYAKEEGHNLLLYAPAEFSFKEVWNRLEKEGVPFVIGFKKDTGKAYVIIRDCDQEKLREVQTNLYIEKRRISEITNSEFFNYFKNEKGNILSYDGLSHHQVKLLYEIAQEKDFVFTRIANDDGKYSVFMHVDNASEDENIIDAALLKLSCLSSGSIAVMEESQSNVDKDLIRGAIDRGLTTKSHFYIVDCYKKNDRKDYIEINDDTFAVFKDGKVMQTYNRREDTNYEVHLAIALLSVKNPVLFDEEHFKVSSEYFEKGLEAATVERNEKISNAIKITLKENKIYTSKKIREVEVELKNKALSSIANWEQNPQVNKINIDELIAGIDKEYETTAQSFVDTFSSVCTNITNTQQKRNIYDIPELQAAAEIEDFSPSFDSRERDQEKTL